MSWIWAPQLRAVGQQLDHRRFVGDQRPHLAGVGGDQREPDHGPADVMAPRRRERLIAPEPVNGNPYVDRWAFLERAISNTGAVQSSEEAAQIIIDLLNADEPPLRVQSSAWTTEFIGAKLADTDGSGTFKALDEYLKLGGLTPSKPGRAARPARLSGRAHLTSIKRSSMAATGYFARTDTVHIATELQDGVRS